MVVEWAPISLDGSRDPAARRHARSLAMRQFRKRQKEELDRQQASTSESTAAGKRWTAKQSGQHRRGTNISRVTSVNNNQGGGFPSTSQSVFNAVTWRNNPEDRIDDPKVMAESLLLCKRYLQWLRPDDRLSDADFAIFVARQALPDPLLIAASCLVAGRYLDAAHFRSPAKDNAERKSEILQILNARLKDTDTPVNADVVNAIVCLLHFELCEGNEEALVHLQGIKALMGGPDSRYILYTSCIMSLEMADLTHALMFSGATEFVSIRKQDPRLEPEYSAYHVDILAGELDHMAAMKKCPGLPKCDLMMRRVSNSIKQSFHMPVHDDYGPFNDDSNTAVSERAVVTSIPGSYMFGLALFVQASQAASSIIYRYAVQGHPIDDAKNQALVEPIIQSLLGMPDAEWQHLKFFRLFLLLTAASVSQEQRRRSFCEAQLVKAILQIGPERWEETRRFFVKYIDNMNACR